METVIVRHISFMNSTTLEHLNGNTITQYIAAHSPQTCFNGRCAYIDTSPLTSPVSLLSLKDHEIINPNDKSIWDRAYLNEYDITEDIHTWTGNALPIMAISTIKKNTDGHPIRSKYRIVVLGNLDTHTWSKGGFFAPVMSQLEFGSMIAAAVRLHRTPKSGDFQMLFANPPCPLMNSTPYDLNFPHHTTSNLFEVNKLTIWSKEITSPLV